MCEQSLSSVETFDPLNEDLATHLPAVIMTVLGN